MSLSISFNGNLYDPVNWEGGGYADVNLGIFPMMVDVSIHHALLTSSRSTSSVDLVSGNKTLIVENYKMFPANMPVRATDQANSNNYMQGQVVSYDMVSGELVISATMIGGTGTVADWLVECVWADYAGFVDAAQTAASDAAQSAANIGQPLSPLSSPTFSSIILTNGLTSGTGTNPVRLTVASSENYQLGAGNGPGNFIYYGATQDTNPDGVVSDNAGQAIIKFKSNRDTLLFGNLKFEFAGLSIGDLSVYPDTVYATNFTTISDRRRKVEDTEVPIETFIDVLRQSPERVYRMRETVVQDNPKKTITHSRLHTGRFAQDVEQVIADKGLNWGLHVYDEQADMHALRPLEEIPILSAWIKILENRLDEQAMLIEELQNRIESQ